MNISTVVDQTINHAVPNPTGSCNACERTGFPILPLRAAYAPEPGSTHKRRASPGSDLESVPMRQDQPRVLRSGYLYVLLDKKEWQAYQVTPEGALRQFRPFQPPRDEPSPLSQWCVDANHDVASSFINIDVDRYSTAWIAIANDPWPKTVLDQYLRGTADDGTTLEARFQKLDLKAARNDPASVGIAMTEAQLGVHQVLEYAEVNAGDFISVHGFYTRNHRLDALEGHIRTLVQREKLPNGVLALVLPDPIGFVQECNAQRVGRFRAMQEWRSEPQRRFELFTSQALLGIKELQTAWAAAEAADEAKAEDAYRRRHNNSLMGDKVTFPPLDIEADTQRRAKSKQADAHERLEARYDEAARASFEKAYLAEQEIRQKTVDGVAELYVREYLAAPFQLAAEYDYSATSWRSVEDFIRMLALCLFGGPTDVIQIDKEKLGTTQRLWKSLLEDRKSLLYQALLSKDRLLLEQLQTALAGNQLGKVYDTIKSITGTEEGKDLMVSPVKQAIGQLLAAAANASNALGQQISTQTQTLVGHVHSAALLRYAGQHVTQVIVSLKLGEYLALLNEVLQERTDQFIAQLDQKFRKPAERKIRAKVLSGAITVAVSSNHGKMVDVMIWSLESAEALQERLEKLRASAGEGISEAVRTVSIGAATLHSGAAQMAQNLAINVEDARALARGAMQRMRNAAISAAPAGGELLLALGSLWFQQDSLRRNYATSLNTPGSGSAEALAAVWSSSIGVMGASVEIAGAGIQILRPNSKVEIQVAGRMTTVSLGTRVAQYGGGSLRYCRSSRRNSVFFLCQ
ncbi:T6SS effector BTH_I2691 family protein [Achromobacter arsenitoxydans]|nr:T6SS effector BTH_I2691 family protein [Achromobacter arsenitoxydans]